MTLDELLAPVEVERFLRESWERQPLYLSREREGCYDTLLSRGEAEALLFSEPGPPPSALRLYRGAQAWSAGERSGSVSRAEHLRGALREGFSLYLHFPERLSPRLGSSLESLGRRWQARALSHLVMSPPRSPGFLPHTDPYGIFVLQLAGRKRWSLHGPSARQSGRGLDHHHLAGARPQACYTLGPGDLLYLPRGIIHATETEDAPSLHLSLALTPPRGVDLLRLLAELAEEEDFFQGYAPFGLGGPLEARQAWARRFSEELAALVSRVDPYELFARRLAQDASKPLER